MSDRVLESLDAVTKRYLISFLQSLADDELILGQRSAEWLGMAPDLEEDIAFSSISQDELGHAMFYFTLLNNLGEGTVDGLAFRRNASERLNTQLVQVENKDFAFTVTRNYLYEVYDELRLETIADSAYQPLADGVRKIAREEYYHRLHLESILQKLSIAGGEATAKVYQALEELWPYLADLGAMDGADKPLQSIGLITASESETWREYSARLQTRFEQLHLPWRPLPELQSRRKIPGQESTTVLERLLAEMNEVSGIVPASAW